MTKLSKLILIAISLSGLAIAIAWPEEPPTIESLESRTVQNKPVFNQIEFLRQGNRDIWMMNQSHDGPLADRQKWDRLAIVVEKQTDGTRSADFLQLPPGPLVWSDDLMKSRRPYRVSCFLCHSNGPRAIRPNPNSASGSSNPLQQLKLLVWNLRIKTYGQISEGAEQKSADLKLQVPFRHRATVDNETLNVPACRKCHDDNAWWGRSALTRQNSLAIGFMIENKIMPPPGFSLTSDERKQLNDFLKGF